MENYAPGSVREQIAAIVTAFGVPDEQADICTQVMYDTDLVGIDSHGISMLPIYFHEIENGSIDPSALPTVVAEGPAFVRIDGNRGFGHLAGHMGMQQAIRKASTAGVGIAVVSNTNHYGAAGWYARMAAEAQMMGITTCSTEMALQYPTGSRQPLLGTNPIAFAAPTAGGEPIVVDMSTSVVPMNKVKVHQLKGIDLPGEWVADSAGRTVSDSARAYAGLGGTGDEATALLPLGGGTTAGGGHKGYALATMVQLLSAGISGAGQPGNVEGFHDIGYFFLAINSELINPGVAADYAQTLKDTIHSLLPIDESQPVQVAGEREELTREHRSEHGIPLPTTLVEQLREVCERTGAPFRLAQV